MYKLNKEGYVDIEFVSKLIFNVKTNRGENKKITIDDDEKGSALYDLLQCKEHIYYILDKKTSSSIISKEYIKLPDGSIGIPINKIITLKEQNITSGTLLIS